jgi:hypothetical protein
MHTNSPIAMIVGIAHLDPLVCFTSFSGNVRDTCATT